MSLDVSSAANPFQDLDEAAYKRALAVLLDVGIALAAELKTPDPATVAARAAATGHPAPAEAARATTPAEPAQPPPRPAPRLAEN